jgi:hypothetical protein
MKKLTYLLFALVALQTACKKDKPAADFVTDYKPALTEAASTVYDGNYYPFATGYTWNWSGNATTSGSMSISAGGQHQTEPLDGSDNIVGYMNVNGPENISLPSGHYTVLSTSETDGTSRYFQVSDTAVIIRAIKMSSMSSPAEVKDPVFLRKPLIVGDKWQSQPSVDYNQMLGASGFSSLGTIDITTKCLIFVLGTENISWNGSTSTMALQERASIIGKINVNESGATGTININFTLDARLNLKENVGLVKQTMVLKGTMNGSISAEGQSASLSMDMTMNTTLTLDTYNVTASGLHTAPALKSAESTVLLKHSSGNPMADRQFNKVMLILKRIQNGIIIK